MFALPKFFNIDLPVDLSNALENAKDDAAARQVGIEWSVQQCKELVNKAPVLHFYTMSYSSATKEVISQIF